MNPDAPEIIDFADPKKRLDQEALPILIDVRLDDDFEAGRIPGAANNCVFVINSNQCTVVITAIHYHWITQVWIRVWIQICSTTIQWIWLLTESWPFYTIVIIKAILRHVERITIDHPDLLSVSERHHTSCLRILITHDHIS